MSYSAYLLVTLVVFVGGGFKAFTSRPGQRLLAWAAEHLRRRALLVLVAALVFTTADLVGVAVFEPELERADNPRNWAPGSISFLGLLVAYCAAWVGATGRSLLPGRDAQVRGSSLARMARLLVLLLCVFGLTGLSWSYLLEGLRAQSQGSEPTTDRASAADGVESAVQQALDAMHFGDCFATADCSGVPMPERATASTCIQLGGLGWQEAPGGCMAPVDWTPPAER